MDLFFREVQSSFVVCASSNDDHTVQSARFGHDLIDRYRDTRFLGHVGSDGERLPLNRLDMDANSSPGTARSIE